MRSFGFWLGRVAVEYVAVIVSVGGVWAKLVPGRSLAAANGERLVPGADRLCLWLRAVGG